MDTIFKFQASQLFYILQKLHQVSIFFSKRIINLNQLAYFITLRDAETSQNTKKKLPKGTILCFKQEKCFLLQICHQVYKLKKNYGIENIFLVLFVPALWTVPILQESSLSVWCQSPLSTGCHGNCLTAKNAHTI